MSYSTLQNNQASEKFMLVRLEPSRYINDLLTDNGGSEYEMPFSYPIAKVIEQGVELVKITSGTPSAGQWIQDEATSTLTLNSSTGPNSTNAIVVYYYIFLTGSKTRVHYEDPEDNTSPLREWLPLISKYPESKQSIENITQGLLSISPTSLNIINDNYNFNQYLTVNDSLYQKDIKVWHYIDSLDNYIKLFNGTVSSVDVERNSIQIRMDDEFGKLLKPAYMGDAYNEAVFTVSGFPNMNTDSESTPCPYIIGPTSRVAYISYEDTNHPEAMHPNVTSSVRGVCTNYNNNLTTSNNRKWGCCRTSSDGYVQFGFTPSAVSHTASQTWLTGTSIEIAKFRVGDSFVTSGSGTFYGIVTYIDIGNNRILVDGISSFILSDTVLSNNCPRVMIDLGSGETRRLEYGKHYSATVTTTSGGNKYLEVTFNNNFESLVSSLSLLNPKEHIVHFIARPINTNFTHSIVIKTLLENAGLSVDATSISSAQTDLDVKATFQIPFYNETRYSNYTKYIQKICESTLGYIRVGLDGEVEYKLFQTPSSSDSTTDIDYIKDSLSVEVDYKDVITNLFTTNEYIPDDENVTQRLVSNKARYLHGEVEYKELFHVLDDMSLRGQDIINLLSEPRSLYTFKVKTKHFNSLLGDDLNLNDNLILSNSQLKILSINKSNEQVEIVASDLNNL